MVRGAGALLALLWLWTGVAAAQPAQPAQAERAKALYRDGQAFFDAGRYDEAIAKWKESYLLSDEPLLLFNLGQAYRLKGECAEARVHYENYLRRGTKIHTREAIEKTLAECEEKNRENREEPEPGDRRPETGDGGKVTPPPPVEIVPEATEVAAPEGREAGKRKKTMAIVLGATGVVLAATGVVFGVMASNDLDELEEAEGEWNDELQSLEDRQARNATMAPIFVGVGLAAVAGGGVLYWMGRREAQQAASIGAAPTAGGGVVFYRGDF